MKSMPNLGSHLRKSAGCAALLLSTLAQAAPPNVDFGHFAPFAPTVALEVDGVNLQSSIAYKGYIRDLPIPTGRHRITARGPDRNIIAERDLELTNDDGLTLILAGDGTSRAPHELLVSIDHNHPFRPGMMSTQEINVAVPAGTDARIGPVFVGTRCSGSAVELRSVSYAYGTAGTADRRYFASNNFAMGRMPSACTTYVSLTSEVANARAFARPAREGLRERVIITGDGVRVPLEAVVIEQAIEPITAVMPASAAFDGLWYDPNNSGSGLLLAHAPTAQDPTRMKAIVYGFDRTGRNVWSRIDGREIQRVAGGTPDGHQATQFFFIAQADLLFHSCSKASFAVFGDASAIGVRSKLFPRNVITLYKLLPAGSCNDPTIG